MLIAGCPGRHPQSGDAALIDATDASYDSNPDVGISIAPVRDPDPLPINEWRYGFVTNTANDLVRQAIETGAFAYPDVGSAYGTMWDGYLPTEMGEIPRPTRGLVYAAAQVDVQAGVHVFARADTIVSLYSADGAQQPGDLYGTGNLRVPVITHSHRLDPLETDFRFTTPGPWISPRHSFVTIQSARDAYQDCVVESSRTGDIVTLTTTNVRGLQIDGSALRAKGVLHINVDGVSHEVTDGSLAFGPQEGKRTGAYGPLNDVLARPFCFVFADDGPTAYRRYAAYLTSNWYTVGNGHACTLPLSRVTAQIRADYDRVYLGVAESVLTPLPMPLHWDANGVALDSVRYDAAAMMFVFPSGPRVSALFTAPVGSEYLLFRIQPFTSSFALPDYYVWNSTSRQAAGVFTSDWQYQPGG